ncbi:MAG: hypothetical protein AB1413_09590 [Thermodesulfobacteriota bacterium]
MSRCDVIHFFYFLSDDHDPLEKAWRQLVGLHGLQEVGLSHFGEGPLLSRLAEGGNASLALSILEHTAIIELHCHGSSCQEPLACIEATRKQLGDLLLDTVGESSCIIQPAPDPGLLGKKVITIELSGGNRLMVAHSPERPGMARRYLLAAPQPQEAKRFLLRSLVPLDILTYQIQRQREYYQVQHDSFLEQEDDLNGRIGKILHRPERDLASLEQDVEKTADIFARMANSSVLLSNSLRLLRADLHQLEALTRKGLHQVEDAYFIGRHGARLREFIATLEASQRNFSRSLDNAKAAIDVMKSRIDLANSRTNLDLQQQIGSLMHQNVAIQEEALTMGTAATLVEFFVVLYYGLGVWKMLAGEEVVHHIPVWLKAGLIVGFSLAVVVGTHKAAEALKEKTFRGSLAWGLVILLLIAAMVGVSMWFAH